MVIDEASEIIKINKFKKVKRLQTFNYKLSFSYFVILYLKHINRKKYLIKCQ